LVDEYPRVWEEIKQTAFERDKKNARAMAEIEALRELKQKNKLTTFSIADINKVVEKVLRVKNEKEAKLERMIQFYNADTSVKDLYEKLDAICLMFGNIDSEMNRVEKSLKRKKFRRANERIKDAEKTR
jgi:hypothetical protein